MYWAASSLLMRFDPADSSPRIAACPPFSSGVAASLTGGLLVGELLVHQLDRFVGGSGEPLLDLVVADLREVVEERCDGAPWGLADVGLAARCAVGVVVDDGVGAAHEAVLRGVTFRGRIWLRILTGST